MTRIAILGGGLSGITAAWQLAQHDRAHGGLEVTLFEASPRLGGTIETVLRDGFVIDCGPDGWVTEKPWARELIRELGLHTKLIASNDRDRVTCIASGRKLIPLPANMRMMVPVIQGVPHDRVEDEVRNAIVGSSTSAAPSLFTPAAIAAYAAEPSRAAELRAAIPTHDESIASFVLRHFGEEVLTKVAAPLLSGVFGGDVHTLSVHAVMPAFVRMEQQHGSLIQALRQKPGAPHLDSEMRERSPSIFTSLELGTQSLIDRMVSELPPNWLRMNTRITGISRVPHSSQSHRDEWVLESPENPDQHETFDHLIFATPAHVTRQLLTPIHPRLAELHTLEATSAVSVSFAFTEAFDLPKGFGFLVPAGEPSQLLAATFTDQKYPHRAPEGCRLLRAFFGGRNAPAVAALIDAEIAVLALAELERYLGKLPTPAFHVLRRWPHSLPQYAVGHLDQVAEIETLTATLPGLHLLGNAYRGVGLPDLIRQARATARTLIPERNPL